MSGETEELRSKKLREARELLSALGLPEAQCNDRSGWVLLALSGVKPAESWGDAQAALLRTVDIMEFIRTHYGKEYMPNSRETIRRQTLHQFEQAGIVIRNADDPARATNSGLTNYQITPPLLEILSEFPDGEWRARIEEDAAGAFRNLAEAYRRERRLNMVPVNLPNGQAVELSPGAHNELQAAIVHEFCPRFMSEESVILYLGDTASSGGDGGKRLVVDDAFLDRLGIAQFAHDKLPDVVAYDRIRDWVFLIEAVTSHGPVSPKRWEELEEALGGCEAGRVYVSAFPDSKEFRKHASNIAWETEVWIADAPDHMVHFNGDRFLGPRGNE